jgi:hypothetical protein
MTHTQKQLTPPSYSPYSFRPFAHTQVPELLQDYVLRGALPAPGELQEAAAAVPTLDVGLALQQLREAAAAAAAAAAATAGAAGAPAVAAAIGCGADGSSSGSLPPPPA